MTSKRKSYNQTCIAALDQGSLYMWSIWFNASNFTKLQIYCYTQFDWFSHKTISSSNHKLKGLSQCEIRVTVGLTGDQCTGVIDLHSYTAKESHFWGSSVSSQPSCWGRAIFRHCMDHADNLCAGNDLGLEQTGCGWYPFNHMVTQAVSFLQLIQDLGEQKQLTAVRTSSLLLWSSAMKTAPKSSRNVSLFLLFFL